MERSNASKSSPRTASNSCARLRTRPAARASAARISNSVCVSVTRLPATATSRPAKSGADAREELARVERLGQVVVGAELEADDLVHVLPLGGDHDDRDAGGVRARAQAAAHLEAVHAGEHEIEKDDVRRLRPGEGQAALAVGRDRDLHLVLAEVLGEQR